MSALTFGVVCDIVFTIEADPPSDMSRLIAHLILSVPRVQATVDRIVATEKAPVEVELRAIGQELCAATGPAHDIMRLIGGLAAEGESALLNAEAC